MAWDMLGMAVIGTLVLAWLWQVRKRQWSWTGLYVSLGCLVFACLNAVAPFRGALDPDYLGYSIGWLKASPGMGVTWIAGTALVASAASALIAASCKSGPFLWLTVLTSAALTVLVGLPLGLSALRDPGSNAIVLGEYVTIPGMVGSAIVLGLMLVPFLIGVVWGTRAARAR